MERGEQISVFINSLVSDTRLRPIHIALSTALCHIWIRSQFKQPYSVSRSQLMRACRIHSKATYHKTLRELQAFGYLEYKPSYHPTNGSSVRLMTPSSESNLTTLTSIP
ncbi:MAG: hypothetical protein JST14_07560 [Bacteroidetes bacterium]|nr:hypothetical protein [Bacteroidota bacterium]